jgi:poly-gamma-glutamate synthesis protein (capsule biosynthesis protein)
MKRPSLAAINAALFVTSTLLLIATIYFKPKSGDGDATAASGRAGTVVVRRARLVFAGDFMQHTTQIRAAQTADGGFDYTASFEHVRDIFRRADVAVLNLETTLAPHPPYSGYPLFRSPPQIATALKDLGVDIAALANNHICDNGIEGLATTVARLDSCGVDCTGAFTDSLQFRARHPLRFGANGLRFALLNYTYGTNGMSLPRPAIVNRIDTAAIADDLARIDRDSTDCVIVFFHWGDEYARRPNERQRALDAFCRLRGADVVIGSHPHVIQPYETHRDTAGITRAVTVYSLGNLVSNQRWRYSDGGLIVALDIEKVDLRPLCIDLTPIPVWVMTPTYRILPGCMADTLGMTDLQRSQYNRFATDTRQLLEQPAHPDTLPTELH